MAANKQTNSALWRDGDVVVGHTGVSVHNYKTGFLFKQTKFFKKWSLKWVVLQGNVLRVFDSPADTNPSATFFLEQAEITSHQNHHSSETSPRPHHESQQQHSSSSATTTTTEQPHETYTHAPTNSEELIEVNIPHHFGQFKALTVRLVPQDREDLQNWMEALKKSTYAYLVSSNEELCGRVGAMEKQIEIDQMLLDQAVNNSATLEAQLLACQKSLEKEKIRREAAERDAVAQLKQAQQTAQVQEEKLKQAIEQAKQQANQAKQELALERRKRIEAEEAHQIAQETAKHVQDAFENANKIVTERLGLQTNVVDSMDGSAEAEKESGDAVEIDCQNAHSSGDDNSDDGNTDSNAPSPRVITTPTAFVGNVGSNGNGNLSAAGYLKRKVAKQSLGIGSQWKVTWCVFTEGVLACYSSPQEVGKRGSKPKQYSVLDHVVRESLETHKHRNPQTVFEIIPAELFIKAATNGTDTNGKTKDDGKGKAKSKDSEQISLFAAESHDDLVKWISIINHAKHSMLKGQISNCEERLQEAEYKITVKVSEVEVLSNEVTRLKWQLNTAQQ